MAIFDLLFKTLHVVNSTLWEFIVLMLVTERFVAHVRATLARSQRDINVSRPPGKFFQSTIYIHAHTRLLLVNHWGVVMFVINFQYRPLRDTVDVPCFNYDGKGWTVHSSQIVLCVFRSFAIKYLMFIKGILSVRFVTLANNNSSTKCINVIRSMHPVQIILHNCTLWLKLHDQLFFTLRKNEITR